MSYVILEQCKICQGEFKADSEDYYWHIKIHQVKKEIGIPEQVEQLKQKLK